MRRGQEVQSFAVSISGRFPAEPITDPETGEVLFGCEHMLNAEDAAVLSARGIERVRIRSVLTMRSEERRLRQVLWHQPGRGPARQPRRGRRRYPRRSL